jgi:hypothetical protein
MFVAFVLFYNIFNCVTVDCSLIYDISQTVSQDIIRVGSLTLQSTIINKRVLILMGKLFRISICNIAIVTLFFSKRLPN